MKIDYSRNITLVTPDPQTTPSDRGDIIDRISVISERVGVNLVLSTNSKANQDDISLSLNRRGVPNQKREGWDPKVEVKVEGGANSKVMLGKALDGLVEDGLVSQQLANETKQVVSDKSEKQAQERAIRTRYPS